MLVRGFNSLLDFASDTATKLTDKYIPSAEYYNYKEPAQKYEPVEKVIEKTFAEIEEYSQAILEEKLVVGGNVVSSDKSKTTSAGNESLNVAANINIINNTHNTIPSNVISSKVNDAEVSVLSHGEDKLKKSAKTRFYANVDRIRVQKLYESQKRRNGTVSINNYNLRLGLKQNLSQETYLAIQNKRLSNGRGASLR